MNKEFSWWRDGHKRFWVLLITAFVIFLLIRKNNVFTWAAGWMEEQSQKREIEEQSQKREIKELEERIADLDEGISQMQEGTDAAERYAREKLHFHADGEDVYLVEE